MEEWTYIDFKDNTIINLPNNGEEILFKFGNDVHAGIFINEVMFKDDEGDFGFFDNRDNYYEAENVLCWMLLMLPETNNG